MSPPVAGGRERRFSDPDTHYHLVFSTTGYAADGYALGEYVCVECGHCGARAEHIDGLAKVHRRWCPQADVVADSEHGPGYDGHPYR
ncbi:hypothetical protein [Halobaculum sp. EA56]|uniref:hypothetical protein n=1 Tax=Halobaculum sp. EA56 TaxID=3421648 RepID=UPI003EBE3AB8